MLLVRISASDQRAIERATSPEELAWVRSRIVELIQQSLTLKSFGTAPSVRSQSFTWKEAFKIANGICGATMPTHPDGIWFNKVNRAIKTYNMDAEFVRKLAEYARDNLRPNPSFEFLVVQHERILSGEFNRAPKPVAVSLGPSLPEE